MPRTSNLPDDLKPDQVIRKTDLDKITASMTKALDSQFADLNTESRKKLLAKTEDLLETAFKLAQGITIQKIEYNKSDNSYDEVVYTTPPYWPTVKYLLEWFRGIADLEKSQKGAGLDGDGVVALLKTFMDDKPEQVRGVAEERDGVMMLSAPEDVDADTSDD